MREAGSRPEASGLLWAGFTLIPLRWPTMPVNLLALIYVLAACVTFALGAALLPGERR